MNLPQNIFLPTPHVRMTAPPLLLSESQVGPNGTYYPKHKYRSDTPPNPAPRNPTYPPGRGPGDFGGNPGPKKPPDVPHRRSVAPMSYGVAPSPAGLFDPGGGFSTQDVIDAIAAKLGY